MALSVESPWVNTKKLVVISYPTCPIWRIWWGDKLLDLRNRSCWGYRPSHIFHALSNKYRCLRAINKKQNHWFNVMPQFHRERWMVYTRNPWNYRDMYMYVLTCGISCSLYTCWFFPAVPSGVVGEQSIINMVECFPWSCCLGFTVSSSGSVRGDIPVQSVLVRTRHEF